MKLPIIGEVKLGKLAELFIVFLAFLYIISPIDLIPDIAPFVGWIDDAIAGLIALLIVAKEVISE